MNKKLKTTLIWSALFAAFFALYLVSTWDKPSHHESYATFMTDVEHNRVASIRVHNNEITVELADGSPNYTTLGAVNDELTQLLSDHGALVTWGKSSRPVVTILTVALPLILLLIFLCYFVKKANTAKTGMFSLGKSRARLLTDSTNVTFDDVGGCTDAKEQLGDIIDFLGNSKRWTDAGARLPRGVLLEGPPGCGKTLLARAVAGETKASFYVVSASEFVELFVGVGAARVRDMFDTAAKNAPSVIFVDELDAVGRRRGSGIGAGHDEREQTLNQLLVCLDGFEKDDRVVVIAATNRSDILDRALLRPGRFDRRIRVPQLSYDARVQTLRIHTRDKSLDDGVSLEDLAVQTRGLSGAQLENIANEATLLAVRRASQDNEKGVRLSRRDFSRAIAAARSDAQEFNKLDTLLIESVTQMARPTGKAIARISRRDASDIIGEIVWADAAFIKVRDLEDETEILVSKYQIVNIEALDGTEVATDADVSTDRWSIEAPGLA